MIPIEPGTKVSFVAPRDERLLEDIGEPERLSYAQLSLDQKIKLELKALGLDCSEDRPFEINQMRCQTAKLSEQLTEERKMVNATKMRLQLAVCEHESDIRQHNERCEALQEADERLGHQLCPMPSLFTDH